MTVGYFVTMEMIYADRLAIGEPCAHVMAFYRDRARQRYKEVLKRNAEALKVAAFKRAAPSSPQ